MFLKMLEIIFKKLDIRSIIWTTLVWILNAQSVLYIFILYALPNLSKSFLPIIKGVRSQMTSLVSFVSHLNTFLISVVLHFFLIENTMRKAMRLYSTVLIPVNQQLNEPNKIFNYLRCLSIFAIVPAEKV